MRPYSFHRLVNNHRSPLGKRTSGWTSTAAAALVLTSNAIGAKPGSGGGVPPATAVYSMERIPQPGWGGDYQIELINERGDAAGVTIIKSGRYTLAGEGFFWDATAKAHRRLSPLPTSATGSVVHNATWGGGLSDDGRIIFGASMRSSADGLVAVPHKDLTPVVWISNGGATTLPAVNLEPQLLAFSATNLSGWGFVSFAPDFGPTVCNRFTASGDFLFLEAVTGTDYFVDVVARLDWTTTTPTVVGMWALGQRRTATEGGFNGNAFSIVEGIRNNRRFVNVAGSYRSFDETGTPTPESAAALGRMPMNWELDVESGVATLLTLSHLDPPVDTTTGWGIDVNALGATIGLAENAGEEVSLAYYWEPDGSPVRPAELPGSNNAMRLYALNASGQAVGNTTTGTSYTSVAVLWAAASNTTKSLTSLAGGSVSFEQAVDINERGQIAVLDAASPSRWYLLTPKP